VFALGSSAYPNFCSFGKFLDNILGELGGERLMKIVLGDDLCGQEQEFRRWACEVFKTSCEVFCLDLNEMSEASMTLKSETLTKENTRFQAVKDFNIPLSARLSKYHNKKVTVCKVKNKPINLHGGATTERSTVLVEIIIDSVSVIIQSQTRVKNFSHRHKKSSRKLEEKFFFCIIFALMIIKTSDYSVDVIRP
jgi:nitric-oxide synthase, brain